MSKRYVTLSIVYAVALRQQYLALQLQQFRFQFGDLVIALLDDRLHIGQRLAIGGDAAQLLGALLDFQFFANFATNRLFDLFESIGQCALREVICEAILVAELVQNWMLDVIALWR